MLVSASALVLSLNYLTSALPSRYLAESSQDPDFKRLRPFAPSPTVFPNHIPTNYSSTNELPMCWPSTSPPDPPVWPITRPSDCGSAIRLIITEHRALYALFLIPLTHHPSPHLFPRQQAPHLPSYRPLYLSPSPPSPLLSLPQTLTNPTPPTAPRRNGPAPTTGPSPAAASSSSPARP